MFVSFYLSFSNLAGVAGVKKADRQKYGEKMRNKFRKANQRKTEELTSKLSQLQREVWRLKKCRTRANRAQGPSPQLSPRAQLRRIIRGQPVKKIQNTSDLMRCVKKTRQKYIRMNLTPRPQSRKGKQNKRENQVSKSIVNFLESKAASVVCPGKKQGRKYQGLQRQRQYMVADLRTLHKEYLAQPESTYTSYRTFCRHRPAWIVAPKLSARDTCLCKTCENFKMLISSGKSNNVIECDSKTEISKTVCCPEVSNECWLRTCNQCKSKKINFNECNDRKPAMYQEWVTVKEKVYSFKAKSEIEIRVMKKKCNYITAGELKDKIEKDIIIYMQHMGRVANQSTAAENLIRNLDESEMAFLIDWSMNFVCKYGREPQSVHFGASHTQIGLHTGRMYMAGGRSQSFCSLSDVTRHDPRAIIAHLLPVLEKYLKAHPNITKLYFMSDGPTNQYRNRELYWLIAKYLTKQFPQIKLIVWIFSEAGHGKGEADGVGGVVKRMADRVVTYGGDVDNLEKLVTVLKTRCPSIDIFVISTQSIISMDSLSIPKTTEVKGTMQMHHYMWSHEKPSYIEFKTLSCLTCPRDQKCVHHSLGEPWSVTGVRERKAAKEKAPPKTARRPAAKQSSAKQSSTKESSAKQTKKRPARKR